jgi:glutaminyl-peptide cyclotransferase
VVLLVQVVLAGAFVVLVATDNVPFVDDDSGASGAPRPKVDRFDAPAAYRLLREQVRLGPRPAGSPASRRLARRLRSLLPRGRFEPVPGGLRNVVGVVPGRTDRTVVVGAHYDTKDAPGFVGANDGAAGTAVVLELARHLRPRQLHATLVFALFDGEESPAGTPDTQFETKGLRGSRVAASRYPGASGMILLDFVGIPHLRLARDLYSDPGLWQKLRSAARRVGALEAFPSATQGEVLDDHTPFVEEGVPAIDLIDFHYPCFHMLCDDLAHVSETSLDEVGETVRALLPRL